MPKGKQRTAAERMEAFARQYVICQSNGQAAAIACGYSPKTACVQASKLLTKAKVKERVKELLAAQNKKLDFSVERVLTQLAKHAFHDPRRLVNDDGTFKRLSEMDADTAACISAVEVTRGNRIKRIKTTDSLRALEIFARYHKLFVEDRNPLDLGVKYVVLDMPRPLRSPGGAAQLPPSNGHKNGHNGNGSGHD